MDKVIPFPTPKVEVEKENVWPCDCGHQLFYLTASGAECHKCGQICTDWPELPREVLTSTPES